ncbi:uncharacterized protein LOC126996584 [Eriocheir sinensis]|uniref:uncharacterized protein LOC126996584 n=1 Tax=Eriocheir sinensis TaxID=95602 RepID=UPI0021C6D299|nr:uncharacterized protein LOC126996584 [Eriocheir sinensis]
MSIDRSLCIDLNINASPCSPVSMVRLDRRAVAVLVVAVGVMMLAAGVAAELTETWFEYRARTKKELKSRAKTSLDKHMELGELHSRQKRSIAFPTGSTFTITPVLCIPVVSIGDLTGFLDIELPFTIKLPNATQVTYGRMDDDRLGIYSVLISTLNRFGVDGKACLLRSVCEVAESPLRDDGLLGEVLNILLTASYGASSSNHLYDYIDAERYGRAYGDCWAAYPQCPMSLFKLFDAYNEL